MQPSSLARRDHGRDGQLRRRLRARAARTITTASIELMEGVEDIPFPVLAEGLPWNWESFPEYLDALEPAALRRRRRQRRSRTRRCGVYVMGERGANREPATPADIAAMARARRARGRGRRARLLDLAHAQPPHERRPADADAHRRRGRARRHRLGLARADGGAGRGVLQVVSDFADPDAEFAMLRRIVERSGRPLSFSLVQHPRDPEQWRRHARSRCRTATADGPADEGPGLRPRRSGILFGFELTLQPVQPSPELPRDRAPAARRARRAPARPAISARACSPRADDGASTASRPTWPRTGRRMFLLGDPPDYEQPPERTHRRAAPRARGVAPEEVALDTCSSRRGARHALPAVPQLRRRQPRSGLRDADAPRHRARASPTAARTSARSATPASRPRTLTHWTRDRDARARSSPLEQVVHMQTQRHRGGRRPARPRAARARLPRRPERDRLRPAATRSRRRWRYDLPAGGRRLVQRRRGYVATIVAGEVTYRDGEPTGALPGRLVRGAQPAPSHGGSDESRVRRPRMTPEVLETACEWTPRTSPTPRAGPRSSPTATSPSSTPRSPSRARSRDDVLEIGKNDFPLPTLAPAARSASSTS